MNRKGTACGKPTGRMNEWNEKQFHRLSLNWHRQTNIRGKTKLQTCQKIEYFDAAMRLCKWP